MDKENPHDYAMRRARETGRRYIVSKLGHVMLDCPMNRQVAEECGEGIACVYWPITQDVTPKVNHK